MGRVQPYRGPCIIIGCPRDARARGMCTTHLERERRWGDPLHLVKPHAPGNTEAERMWSKVEQDGDCWRYAGTPLANGYAQVGLKGTLVHRLAWTDMVGANIDGLDLDHLCHNQDLTCPGGAACRHRVCVNPAHLEPVPRSINSYRRWARDRKVAA